jgi:hypothetical protein
MKKGRKIKNICGFKAKSLNGKIKFSLSLTQTLGVGGRSV